MPHNPLNQNNATTGLHLSVQDYYDLYIGSPKVIGTATSSDGRSSSRFIRQPLHETDEEHAQRALWTAYFNYQKKIINIYGSYLFANKPSIEASDLNLEHLARLAAKHAFIAGVSYILTIDHPIVYTALQVKHEEEGVFSVRKGHPDETFIDLNKGTITNNGQKKPLGIGQFVICVWDEIAISLIADTAPINISIYNLLSVQDTHIARSIVYWITGPSIGEEKEPLPYTYIPVEGAEAKVVISNPDVMPIQSIAEEIKSRVTEMGSIVGLSEEFGAEITAGESAVAREMRTQDTNAILTSAAFHISRCINESVTFWGSLKSGRKGGSITLNPRLKVADRAEIFALLSMAKRELQFDEIAKEVQKRMLEVTLGQDLTSERLAELKELIDNDGGLNTMSQDLFQVDGSRPDLQNEVVVEE